MRARALTSLSRGIAAVGLLIVVGLGGARTADAQYCSPYYGCAGGYGYYSPYYGGVFPYSYLNSSYYAQPQITYTAFPYSGFVTDVYGFSNYFNLFPSYVTPGSSYYGLVGTPYRGYYGYGYIGPYGMPYTTASQIYPGYWNFSPPNAYCFPCSDR